MTSKINSQSYLGLYAYAAAPRDILDGMKARREFLQARNPLAAISAASARDERIALASAHKIKLQREAHQFLVYRGESKLYRFKSLADALGHITSYFL